MGATTLGLGLSVAPASATGQDDAANAIEAIESVAPESLAAVATADGVVLSDPADAEVDEFGRSAAKAAMIDPTNPESPIRVEIPEDPADGILLEQAGFASINIGLPNSAQADDVEYGDLDIATYDNNDGSKTVPIVNPDGAVQITTVISGPEAPARYVYPITMPAGAELVDAGDGYFAVVQADSTPLAMIEPAWALDANGNDVATRYEVEGHSLVQVVEHGDGTAYPVVADPAVAGKYIKKFTITKKTNGFTFGIYPVNAWNVTVSASEYYAEYKLYVNSQYEGQKYYDQIRCHWDFAPFKTPWNIDSWRPNVGYAATVAALCNP
ncbi:uncharacterized protein DUF2599 [Isoptericola jiangsuensis]|uniref:Uncharacterized protein DUF2599 n=1 Tax=Isoptericola jiangsuensis TaxID=548579 RepID=A0A2A9EWY6_9MICO|nr:uncharacterized protein DUF2599 [Isoptericola jiangsuensis]